MLSLRRDKFFDSLGPGGVRSPSYQTEAKARSLKCHTGRLLEVDSASLCEFAHYGYVYCMAIVNGSSINANAEEVLISGGGDGAIRLWTLDKETNGSISLLATLEDTREETESVLAFAVDGSFLFSGHVGGEVHAWDLESRQLLRVMHSSTQDILSMTIGTSNLFSADEKGEVRVRYSGPDLICVLAYFCLRHTTRTLSLHDPGRRMRVES